MSIPSGLAAALPEDLYCLIKKAVAVRKHLERNRKVLKIYPHFNSLWLYLAATFKVRIV